MKTPSLPESITAEHAMLGLFLVISIYMYIGARDLSERAAAFPRFTAALTIVGVTLLLFRSVLPAPLDRLVTDSGGAFEDIVDGDDVAQDDESPDEEPAEQEGARTVMLFGRSVHGTAFAAVLTTGFVIASYLFGMLWVAPVFVAVYLTALDRPLKATVGLAVLAFLMVYGFIAVLGINADAGILFDPAVFGW